MQQYNILHSAHVFVKFMETKCCFYLFGHNLGNEHDTTPYMYFQSFRYVRNGEPSSCEYHALHNNGFLIFNNCNQWPAAFMTKKSHKLDMMSPSIELVSEHVAKRHWIHDLEPMIAISDSSYFLRRRFYWYLESTFTLYDNKKSRTCGTSELCARIRSQSPPDPLSGADWSSLYFEPLIGLDRLHEFWERIRGGGGFVTISHYW